jgi:hypothetical protein
VGNVFKNKSIFSVNTVIAIALVLSTFTQLRFSELPIGISDLFFLSYLLYSFGILSISKAHIQSNKIINSRRKQILPIFAFIVLYTMLLFAGTIYAYFLFKTSDLIPSFYNDAEGLFMAPYHNLIAFSYLSVIFLFAYIRGDLNLKKISYYTILILSVCISLLFIISLFKNNIFGLNLYYLWTDRLILFTKSPNHLADFIAPIPFFLIHFFYNTKSFYSKLFYIILFLIIIAVGLSSQSKATIYGWIMAFPFLIISCAIKNVYLRYYLIITGVLLFIFLLIFFISYYEDYFLNSIENLNFSWLTNINFKSIMLDISTRFGLFLNAIELGNISPIIGLGAGASSGISEPFMGRESHNHISEVLMSTGYLGIMLYLSLMFYIFYKINFANQPFLFYAFLIISVISLFHYQLRQPLFWFYLLFLINLSDNAYLNYRDNINEL